MSTTQTSSVDRKFPLQRDEAFHRLSQIKNEKTGEYTVSYNLILTLRKSTDSNSSFPENNFEGRQELTFSYNDSKQEDIFLNFKGNVHSIKINGKDSNINYKNCRIYLNHSDLVANAINKVVILFSTKYDKSGAGLHHFIDPIDKKEYLYTQFEPYDCNLVFPVFDQPSIKGTLTISLVGPDDWTMLSNEKEICKWNIDDSTRTRDADVEVIKQRISSLSTEEYEFLFKSIYDKHYKITFFDTTPKIAPYLYAICAGPYHCINNPYQYIVPIRIFMRDSLKFCGEPKEFFRVIMRGMEWYKNFFGIAYPFTKYDQLFAPEYNFGAMENVGLVTYNELYCWKDKPSQQRRAKFSITVLHELAHMWFGNLVTMQWWDDLWLNESFATFISFLCQSQAVNDEYKNTWVAFNNMKGFAYREDQKNTTHPVMGDITDTEKSESHFDSIVYYKGSSFVKQMFYFIGEKNFSNGLKEYFKTYKWGNTKFDDFVDKMAEQLEKNASKDDIKFDLKALCKKWLTEAGLNQITCDWENDGDKIKSFTVSQSPCLKEHPNLQIHKFEVLFIYENSSENMVKTIMIPAEGKYIVPEFTGVNAPKAVILNYNDWGFFKWVVDKKTLEYLKINLLEKLPDTLSRQMFYRSLFDMTRDAELPAQEYLDIISTFLQTETSEDILSNVLRNVNGVVYNYLPKTMSKEYANKIFDLIQRLLIRHISNKEIVMLLLELLPAFVAKEENTLLLKKWLDTNELNVSIDNQQVKIPTELLSQDLRFRICALVYELSSISLEEKEKLLNKEIEKDKNSDRSILAKNRCKASLPNPEIKKELWDTFINKPNSDSLYNLKAYMSGFRPFGQLELVEEYCKVRFFEDILKIAKMDYFYLGAFVAYCSPSFWVEDEVIKKLEEKAKEITMSDILQRDILELVDDMKRFKKTQELALSYKK